MKLKGLPQALGVTAYCLVIGFVVYNGSSVLGKISNFAGPAAFLLLFSTSALICSLIVLYEPYKLFVEKKYKEAVDLLVRTTIWLFICFAVVFTFAFAVLP